LIDGTNASLAEEEDSDEDNSDERHNGGYWRISSDMEEGSPVLQDEGSPALQEEKSPVLHQDQNHE
jgi:hypothetical protein